MYRDESRVDVVDGGGMGEGVVCLSSPGQLRQLSLCHCLDEAGRGGEEVEEEAKCNCEVPAWYQLGTNH